MKQGWWDRLAASVQAANRITEDAKDDKYTADHVKRSIVYTREDLAMIVVLLSALNRQVRILTIIISILTVRCDLDLSPFRPVLRRGVNASQTPQRETEDRARALRLRPGSGVGRRRGRGAGGIACRSEGTTIIRRSRQRDERARRRQRGMSDRPPALARMPSWGENTPPWPGAWCRACYGTHWWTERRDPHGWHCLTCHPPDHLSPEAIRRENEPEDAGPAAPRAPDRDADPLFRQAGVALDDEG
jgi:hypothetical protein